MKLSNTKLSKIVPSGGFLGRLVGHVTNALFQAEIEIVKRDLEILADKGTKYFVNEKGNELAKLITSSEITGKSNKIKYIIKIIDSLKNKRILLKGTTEKIINQKRAFLSALMRVGLPLMKNELKPLVKMFCCH